ncbi:MAG: VOC family protein [Alphaproteobacteria bacterium]
MSNAAATQGAHHIGLTVPDLAATRSFFVNTLGFNQVGEVPDYPAVFVSDGATMVTLWQVADPATARAVDRSNNIGLHHLALKVADAATLDNLARRLAADSTVAIEFSPESLGGGPTQHMMCTIPGGIRLELIAPVG